MNVQSLIKKATINRRYYIIMLHVLVWGILLFFPFMISDRKSQYKIDIVPGLYFTLSGIVHILIFYLNAFILYPKLLNRKYWLLYAISVIVLILASYYIKLYMLDAIFNVTSSNPRNYVLLPSIFTFIGSIFYCITLEKLKNERKEKESKVLQTETEIKFLRSQINPHFIFNLLTNLTYLARKKSENLEPSLLKFADLMRYMLFDTTKKITVEQELEFIRSYVFLQQLRFGNDVKVNLDIKVDAAAVNKTIEPMLLIPFIENAFKHGIGNTKDPYILITLQAGNSDLNFKIENRVDCLNDKNKDETSGIGLNNVRSRLQLLYPGSHTLAIDKGNGIFHISLNLLLL